MVRPLWTAATGSTPGAGRGAGALLPATAARPPAAGGGGGRKSGFCWWLTVWIHRLDAVDLICPVEDVGDHLPYIGGVVEHRGENGILAPPLN